MSEDIFSKSCDICRIQPAVLLFRVFDGKEVFHQGLCPQCALKKFSSTDISELNANYPEMLQAINEMKNILSAIVGHIGKLTENEEPPTKVCRVCGHPAEEIKRFGNVGCSICYDEFHDIIKERLIKNSYGSKHKGHIPQRYRKQHFEMLELEKLQLKLQALLRKENYEEAAKIRNRIKKIQKIK